MSSITALDDQGRPVRRGSTVKPAKYRARWRTPDGASRSRTFPTKGAAAAWLTSVDHSQLVGGYVDPVAGKVKLSTVIDAYLERGGAWRPRTRQTATDRLAAARTVLGDRTVASIRRSDVQGFINGLQLAPSTAKVVHQHLAAVFELAVDDGRIAVNPARKVSLPRVTAAPLVPLTQDELDRLLAGAAPWFRVALVLGAGLGLRLGEAAGLTVDRIDFLRRTVTVDRQWQQQAATKPGELVPPKTEASARVIPAAPEVLEQVAAHLAAEGRRDGFVVRRDAAPLSAPTWEYQMRRARKAAGLADVTFHDLRHFYASALIAQGCSVKAVQSALGHRSAKMTLDVYGHLFPGDEDRIRSAGGQAFRGSASATG